MEREVFVVEPFLSTLLPPEPNCADHVQGSGQKSPFRGTALEKGPQKEPFPRVMESKETRLSLGKKEGKFTKVKTNH